MQCIMIGQRSRSYQGKIPYELRKSLIGPVVDICLELCQFHRMKATLNSYFLALIVLKAIGSLMTS